MFTKIIFSALFVFASTFVALADELPPDFLGSWTSQTSNGIEIGGIAVTARTYHEPGYNCAIQKTKKSGDIADATAYVFVVELVCANDGYNPGPARKLREVWALRHIKEDDFLIIAGSSSIRVLQRAR